MRRGLLIAIVLLPGAVYLGDDISLRFGIPNRREAFGVVHVKRYYAVRLKNRKVEYMPGDAQDVVCVRSLFPHFGHPPCWYLERHQEQRIEVGSSRGISFPPPARPQVDGSALAAAGRSRRE